MRRTLVLIRHAEATSAAPSDVERELTPAGKEMARALGGWLRDAGIVPDAALVSGATRTRQTWAGLAGTAGWQLAPTYDDGLYTAGPDTALDLIRFADHEASTADESRTLVVLGHNPTVHFLAQVLGDGAGDPQAEGMLIAGFPPASVAVLDFDVEWSSVAEGYGRLRTVRLGR